MPPCARSSGAWEEPITRVNMNRRDALRLALSLSAAAGLCLAPPRAHAAGTINFADIGVGDPGGDWSKFKAASGYERQSGLDRQCPLGRPQRAGRLAAARAPMTSSTSSAACRSRWSTTTLVEKIDTSRLPNWANDSNIDEFLGKGKPGFQFIGYRTMTSMACRPFCRATASPICRRRPASSIPMPRCSIRSGRAMWRSRTITPPPARRPRSISRRLASPRSTIPTT